MIFEWKENPQCTQKLNMSKLNISGLECTSGWPELRCTPKVEASGAHDWYWLLSSWLELRCIPPQYRHLVAKSCTTSGQLDILLAFGSGWHLVRCLPQYYHLVAKTGTTLGPVDLSSDVPQIEASSGQEWNYCRSPWHLVSLCIRLMFGQMNPNPHHPNMPSQCPPSQHSNLVAKSGTTTSGQLELWSAFLSDWLVYSKVNLVPAAMVIPAPWAHIKVVVHKKLISYCLQFSIDHL